MRVEGLHPRHFYELGRSEKRPPLNQTSQPDVVNTVTLRKPREVQGLVRRSSG
jgi:hypothetical protein